MKQVFQHLRTGEIEIAELPCPQAGKGQILIRTHRSIISLGTERMLVEFGKAKSMKIKLQSLTTRITSQYQVRMIDTVG